MNFKNILFFVVIIVLMNACKQNVHEKQRQQRAVKQKYEDRLIEANKGLVARDSARILGVARANDWEMDVTGTGLWYQIIEKGSGPRAQIGQIAEIDYEVRLLNGQLAYSADSTGPLRFRLSKGGVERGLEEGVLLLHKGDSARFIMPPYMAHHLLGDQKKIPPRSTIIYEVRLISLKK